MVCRAFCKILTLFLIFTNPLWAAKYSFLDKRNKKITIDVPVKRAVIVTSYELIPALNIWNQIVGVSTWAEQHCDIYRAIIKIHPEFKKPTVGVGTNLNIESIVKLNPDLIITWTYEPQVINYLESSGFVVFAIYPESLKELQKVLKTYGILFGKQKRAELVLKEMNKIFEFIRSKTEQIPSKHKKKILYLCGKPTTVAGGIGISNELISLIGGENPAQIIKQGYADVSVERILMWDPDIIFIWGNAGYNPYWILKNSQWKYIKAVRMRQVYKLPSWSTWSPRVALIALYMAIKAYPRLFSKVNFKRIKDNFYKEVFGVSSFCVENYEKH